MRASRSDSQGGILSRQPGRTNGLPPAELLLLWPGGLRVGRRGGRQSTYQIVCQAPEQNCCARRSDTPRSIRPKRAEPNRRGSSVLGRPPVEQRQNAGPPTRGGASGGNHGTRPRLAALPRRYVCAQTPSRQEVLRARPAAWHRVIQSPQSTAQSARHEAASSSGFPCAKRTGLE